MRFTIRSGELTCKPRLSTLPYPTTCRKTERLRGEVDMPELELSSATALAGKGCKRFCYCLWLQPPTNPNSYSPGGGVQTACLQAGLLQRWISIAWAWLSVGAGSVGGGLHVNLLAARRNVQPAVNTNPAQEQHLHPCVAQDCRASWANSECSRQGSRSIQSGAASYTHHHRPASAPSLNLERQLAIHSVPPNSTLSAMPIGYKKCSASGRTIQTAFAAERCASAQQV